MAGFTFEPSRAQQLLQQGAAEGARINDSTQVAKSVMGKYCITCHRNKVRTGGLSLESAELEHIPKGAETWEKVIRKVRAGMMPPPGMPRPDKQILDAFSRFLETSLDEAAVANRRPGRATAHR